MIDAETETAVSLPDGHAGCACGDARVGDIPVLDAREIVHAMGHAAVFGVLDSLPSGGALVLVAPHDPKHLLSQAGDRYPTGIEVEYLQRGPGAWRVRLQRT